MKRYRLLDLFCGAGGASVGYAMAGFDVVGVDIHPMPHYPGEFYQADALEYPLDGFDVIHASPPCQAYVDKNINRSSKHPRLIKPIRERLLTAGVPYIIENVDLAPIRKDLILCGTSFNLLVIRHRKFELSFPAPIQPKCNHIGTVASGDYAGIYGFGAQGHRRGNGIRDKATLGPNTRLAMGIDWMNRRELREAIPPAYTLYIGKHLMEHVLND